LYNVLDLPQSPKNLFGSGKNCLEVEAVCPIAMNIGPLFSMTELYSGQQKNIEKSSFKMAKNPGPYQPLFPWTFLPNKGAPNQLCPYQVEFGPNMNNLLSKTNRVFGPLGAPKRVGYLEWRGPLVENGAIETDRRIVRDRISLF